MKFGGEDFPGDIWILKFYLKFNCSVEHTVGHLF